MPQLRVKEALIAKDVEVAHYTGDDGFPAAQVFSPVGVVTEDEREFFLPIAKREQGEQGVYFRERYSVEMMVDKVRRQGSIDTDLWVELDTRPLGEKLAEEALIEAEQQHEYTSRFF